MVGTIVVGCMLHGILYADFFREFATETSAFTDTILPEAQGSRLAGLILDPYFRETLSCLYFPNYYIVRKQSHPQNSPESKFPRVVGTIHCR